MRLKMMGMGLLLMALSSCMTAMYTAGRVMGHENSLRSDFPVGNMHFQSASASRDPIPKKVRFALQSQHSDRMSRMVAKRFEQALRAKGYQCSQEEGADYILTYSYWPTQEGAYYKNDISMDVKIWKNTAEKPLVWEARVECSKKRGMLSGFPKNSREQGGLLAEYESSTLYGSFHCLRMDYFIAAMVDHLGKEVSDPNLEMHPKNFRYLSQHFPADL
ncbi:MAG: hypothetical protein JSS10_02555 [Verrucomicrobia bacterium]|nr:hypothetical protein [Verrucomicrobiota bacterium]